MPIVDPNKTLRFTFTELAEVDSTNAYALRCAERLPHGAVVLAKRQAAGRGRSGRKWHSPEGNLYMTVLIKDLPEPIRAWGMAWLTLAMAVAVCRTLEECGLAPRIKWPNDVLLQGRKVAGILAEARWQAGRISALALGVGVNLNMSSEEADTIEAGAAVVRQVLGNTVDIQRFAREVVTAFSAAVAAVDQTGPERLKQEIRRRAWFLGRTVAVAREGGTVSVRAVGLDDSGALLVEDERGQRHTVMSGDLTCW